MEDAFGEFALENVEFQQEVLGEEGDLHSVFHDRADDGLVELE